MSFNADQLYNLLPAVHRVRDADQGYPLRQSLAVLAEQTAVLEENLEQLYDNQFVETAAPWALPYLADLLGVRGLNPRQTATLNARAEVGHTVAYRRRKGTAAMLEQLARDVTGCPARAVEFFARLAATQHWNHLRPQCRGFASLRDASALEFFNTPFETAARTVEVRRIASGRGKWNIPNVGVFLWRLRAFALTRAPLAPAPLSDRHFRFHPLGLDAPLFSRPETESEITRLAEPGNVPLPFTQRLLRGAAVAAAAFPNHHLCFHPSAAYYGPGKSLVLELAPASAGASPTLVPAEKIILSDLADLHADAGEPTKVTGWTHENDGVADGFVLLDPRRGRVVFAVDQDPAAPPLATFHYGFSANLGGGEYDRVNSFLAGRPRLVAVVPQAVTNPLSHATLAAALGAVLPTLTALEPKSGLVELTDSGRYELNLAKIDVAGGQLEMRAADGHRPLVLLTPPTPPVAPFEFTGSAAGAVSLNGFLLAGAALKITGGLGFFRVRHCTLASQLVVHADGTLGDSPPPPPCVVIDSPGTRVEFESCLLGPVHAGRDVVLSFRNCVIDARGAANLALSDDHATAGPSRWTLENCTVIGRVDVGVLALAANTIFLGDTVSVQRRQEGCVRFCWLPPGAQVPRQYRCLPAAGGPDARPQFTSLRYGDAAYAQLRGAGDEPVRTGADDGSEVGVFHDLFQPQREAHLRARLAEYLRFGLEAGVFYAS